MVNLWPGVPTSCLCDKHLNAAINEGLNLLIRYHIAKGHKLDGWIKNGCIDPHAIIIRIEDLINESKNRGKPWSYMIMGEDHAIVVEYYLNNPPQKMSELLDANEEAIKNNRAKLAARCPKCKDRMEQTK